MDKIKNIITNKITEHKLEIEGSDKALELLKQNNKSKPDFQSIAKMGILKDKIIFHKAAIAVLQDLLEDIK